MVCDLSAILAEYINVSNGSSLHDGRRILCPGIPYKRHLVKLARSRCASGGVTRL